MLRNVMRVLLACFFGLLTLILHLIGRYAPDLVHVIYPAVSQNILRMLAGFFSAFPIAMWEIIALVLLIWMLYTLVRDFSQLHFLRWISGFLMCASVGLFAVMLLWGLNYYSPPMHEKLELSGQEYSVQQLQQAATYYRDMANQTASAVPRDNEGVMKSGNFRVLAEASLESYESLSRKFHSFDGPKAEPKKLIIGQWLGIEGIFVPFTGECCVSTDTYGACVPFAMCREIGHMRGFVGEGEAEFAAFLACTVSDSAELRYSGYFNAFSFCYNALYAADRKAAEEVWRGVSQPVRTDCAARLELVSQQWNQAATAVQKDLREAYAKSFQTEEGGPEHDSVTELLTMWYYERIK